MNGSIDLINCLDTRDLFLSKDEYIPNRRFRPGKSGTNRKRRRRASGVEKLGQSPKGKKREWLVPGESRPGQRGESMTKDARTEEGRI